MLKEKQLLQLIEGLPDQFSAEELIDRIVLLQKIQQGEQDLKEGKGLTTDEVKHRLRKWL